MTITSLGVLLPNIALRAYITLPGLQYPGWSGTPQGKYSTPHAFRISLLTYVVTRTVLASAGNDGRIRLWKATTGSIWRPAGYITVEQAEEQQKEGDIEMDDGHPAE